MPTDKFQSKSFLRLKSPSLACENNSRELIQSEFNPRGLFGSNALGTEFKWVSYNFFGILIN